MPRSGNSRVVDLVYEYLKENGPQNTFTIYDFMNERKNWEGGRATVSVTIHQIAQVLRTHPAFKVIREEREFVNDRGPSRPVKVYGIVPVNILVDNIVGRTHNITVRKKQPAFLRAALEERERGF